MRTPLKEKIKTLSTEIRLVLPSAQALLGFQFSAVLSEAFGRLPATKSVPVRIVKKPGSNRRRAFDDSAGFPSAGVPPAPT